jgi:hypothetical protein
LSVKERREDLKVKEEDEGDEIAGIMKQGGKAANKVGAFFKGAFKKLETKIDKLMYSDFTE